MNATAPCRWFQLHLSTCIVMMFAASALLYLNLVSRIIDPNPDNKSFHISGPPDYIAKTHALRELWGWPFNYRIYYDPGHRESAEKARQALQELPQDASIFDKLPFAIEAEEYEDWFLSAIAYNALAALGILTAAALLWEWFLRRREARKP